VKVFCR